VQQCCNSAGLASGLSLGDAPAQRSAIFFLACDPEDFTRTELKERKFFEKWPA